MGLLKRVHPIELDKSTTLDISYCLSMCIIRKDHAEAEPNYVNVGKLDFNRI